MAKVRLVRKRCARCGLPSTVPVAVRKCRQPRFGRGSYACWGDLVTVRARREAAAEDAVPAPGGLGLVFAEDATRALNERARALARARLERARRRLAENRVAHERLSRAVAAASRRVRDWERRAARYEAAAAMTDAQLDAARASRQERSAARAARRVRRGIRLA